MNFLTAEQARKIAAEYGTPVYVYSEEVLIRAAEELLACPGVDSVRYAMKALPTKAILWLLHQAGLKIDASSGYEANRALAAGIPACDIQLTCQEMPDKIYYLASAGVQFNACSLLQLRSYGQMLGKTPRPRHVSIRINPGLGSGHCGKTNVGGPSSSFGIWHEKLQEAKEIADQYGLTISRLHTHIGSGSDPAVWVKVAGMSLAIAEQLPEVQVLNLGGGLKVGRMHGEQSIDLQTCGQAIRQAFQDFAARTGRYLKLEIEPGTYVVAAAGALICTVIDMVDTRPDENGLQFLKVNSGMTEIARPTLYGAQHPMELVPADFKPRPLTPNQNYVVSGHCCESGDILTPAPGDPNTVATRAFPAAEIGDLLVIDYAGAYCSGMPMTGYNSFPAAAEVLLQQNGAWRLIRRRQTLEQLTENERF